VKTEVVYDGKVLEARLLALKNLLDIVSDLRILIDIEDTEKMIIDKQRFAEAPNSHIFYDVFLDDDFYPIIAVGNYGAAIIGNRNNPLFTPTNRRIKPINGLEDIARLRQSPFCVYQHYEDLIKDNMRVDKPKKVVPRDYDLDFELFTHSDLWKQLDSIRGVEAEKQKLAPCRVYTQRDVYEYLSLFPTQIITSCGIEPEFQRLILSEWESFLQRRVDI
jgi:hypothetical protein